MNRRDFSLLSLAIIASGAGGGYLLSSYKANEHLRPPGAAKHFESLCIKCGQCLQVCPYHSISLLGVDDGVNIGSAYIDASKRGCYLCDLFPCVLACPSGALDHNTTTIKDVKMGVAVVINESSCYANKVISKNQVEHLLVRKTYNDREEKAKQIIADNVFQTFCIFHKKTGLDICLAPLLINLIHQYLLHRLNQLHQYPAY